MTESDGYQAQWLPHPAVPIRVTFDDQRLYEGVNAYEPWLCRGSFCSGVDARQTRNTPHHLDSSSDRYGTNLRHN